MSTLDVQPVIPRKMIRILVYPNITYAKDIAKDSFVQYLSTTIRQLNAIRNDLWWYVMMPDAISALNFPNVTHLEWPVPTHPPAMRVHFDVLRAKSLLSHDRDYDLIWSHLPEQTHALYSTCVNLTHHRPAVFGYAHWFDLPHVATWDGESFRENISGLLRMSHCYLNTHAQKRLVVEHAAQTYTPAICDRLEQDILRPLPPGVEADSCVSEILRDTEKVIVFNHRADPSKDFAGFMQAMRLLRQQRQDFTVWVPLLDAKSATEDWIVTSRFDKADYYQQLRLCRVGIAPKQTYAGWSISTTDGLMNGCPYVFHDSDAYKELHPTGETFTSWGEALPLLHRYLDDQTHRNAAAEDALRRARALDSRHAAERISQDITALVQSLRVMSTPTAHEIIRFVETHRVVTKRDLLKSLGWGRGIAWTPYRRALLAHPQIVDTYGDEPCYRWVES